MWMWIRIYSQDLFPGLSQFPKMFAQGSCTCWPQLRSHQARLLHLLAPASSEATHPGYCIVCRPRLRSHQARLLHLLAPAPKPPRPLIMLLD